MELVDCTFSGKLTKVIINGTVPPEDAIDLGRTRNEIRGNDFTRTKLSDVGFRTGVDLTLQKFADNGPHLIIWHAEEAVSTARKQINRWSNLEERQSVMSTLGILETMVAEGQKQLFLDLANIGKARRPVVAKLYTLLQEADTHL